MKENRKSFKFRKNESYIDSALEKEKQKAKTKEIKFGQRTWKGKKPKVKMSNKKKPNKQLFILEKDVKHKINKIENKEQQKEFAKI